MMVNLLRSELLRLVSSRVFVGFVLVTVVLSCWASISAAGSAAEITEVEVAVAKQSHQEFMELWRAEQAAYQKDCDSGHRWACERLEENKAPRLEDLLREVVSFSDQVKSTMEGLNVVLLVIATVFVSLYVGSQFTTGAISTQLTFTPARQHVLWAKVLVGMLAAGLLSLLGLGVGLAMDVLTFMWVRGPVDLGVHGSLGLPLLRYLVAALLAGMLCALLAISFSSTWKGLVAVGLVSYGGLVLGWSSGVYGSWWQAVLPHRYIVAVVQGGYPVANESAPYGGAEEELVVLEGYNRVVTFWDGLVYCLLVLAILAPTAIWLFHRRDMVK
ncbi:MAG: hypothetical protein Q4D96_11385 [Propionibacteriaceae bacterium]|nr:hypothetical protein [Propionibacteriaceae bacterium]